MSEDLPVEIYIFNTPVNNVNQITNQTPTTSSSIPVTGKTYIVYKLDEPALVDLIEFTYNKPVTAILKAPKNDKTRTFEPVSLYYFLLYQIPTTSPSNKQQLVWVQDITLQIYH